MKAREIVIGLMALVVLITAVLVIKKYLNKKAITVSPSQPISIQQKIQNTFPGLNIPKDEPQTNLFDITGGESYGVATKSEVLANLPDLPQGKFYQVWLLDSQDKKVFLGNLKKAKGGYLIEYDSSKYSGFTKIIVSAEGKNILEGSF